MTSPDDIYQRAQVTVGKVRPDLTVATGNSFESANESVSNGEPEVLDSQTIAGMVEAWLSTYVKTAQTSDLHTLTLWVLHTHLASELYTTPRLLLDSPVPGSGKTTVLDHLKHLCFKPVQAASLSSPSLLARLLEKEPRTILIDEADRTLHPKADGVGELLAVLNSGYRRGASRPVLVQKKNEDGATVWDPVEMSTYGPVAMAGNSPDLPDDTRSRCISVLLLPDLDGTVQDSDWEMIEESANELHNEIEAWANSVRETVSMNRPDMSKNVLKDLKGRNRERWLPLYRVAKLAGNEWESRCIKLIENDLEQMKMDKEAGLVRTKRHVALLQDIAAVWPKEQPFFATTDLLRTLSMHSPEMWGIGSGKGALSPQGMGRMLSSKYSIRADRLPGGSRERGYFRHDFEPAWSALQIAY
ncbi:DUF3631 domain-containing protein [Corynebacterium sp. S7]